VDIVAGTLGPIVMQANTTVTRSPGKRRRKLILDVKIGPSSTDHWTLAGEPSFYVYVKHRLHCFDLSTCRTTCFTAFCTTNQR